MNDCDLENRLEKCIKCGKSVPKDDVDAAYCSECGTSLYNMCSNYSCGEYLAHKDKYCKYCGSPSLFFNAGYFDPELDDELPF